MKTIYHYFDLEASNILTTKGQEVAVVYLTCLMTYDLDKDQEIKTVHGRNMMDFISELKKLNENGSHNVIYCHNLSYEFSFILNAFVKNGYRFNLKESIFKKDSSPLLVKMEDFPNVELRCSKQLLGYSVKDLGQKIGLEKLEYDHLIIRLPIDKLLPIDYKYNKTDCLIVAKTMAKDVAEGKYSSKDIPLTKTSLVGKRNKNKFYDKYFEKNKKGTRTRKSLVNHKKTQLFTEDFYKLLSESFQGGLAGSTEKFTNKLLKNVHAIDLKSSFISEMFQKFPLFTVGNGTLARFDGINATRFIKEYEKDNSICKGFVGRFRFLNVKAKDPKIVLPINMNERIEVLDSEDEAFGFINSNRQGIKMNKVHMAKILTLSMDHVAFNTFIQCYDYEKMSCHSLHVTKADRYLPTCFTSYVLNLFAGKETLDPESKEYRHFKDGLNGQYGSMVINPLMSEWIQDEKTGLIKEHGYRTKGLSDEEKTKIFDNFIDNYADYCNSNHNIYSDGIYIASYAKKTLVEMQLALNDLGCNIVMVDTDSCKFLIPDNVNQKDVYDFIDKWNKEKVLKNSKNTRFESFKSLLTINKDLCKIVTGNEKLTKEAWNKILQLGTWQSENFKDEQGNVIPFKWFKTLGTKKYAYVTDTKEGQKVVTKVAGCSTDLGNHITDYANENGLDLGYAMDSIFRPRMVFTANVCNNTNSIFTNPYETDETEIFFDTDYSNDNGLYERPEGIIKLEDQFNGCIIKKAKYSLDLEVDAASTMYGLNVVNDSYDSFKYDIFDGKQIIRSNNKSYDFFKESLEEFNYFK